MKNRLSTLLGVLALAGASATFVLAQPALGGGNPPPKPPGGEEHGPDGEHGHRPPPPIIAALDANKDGVIDAQEIANASKALLTLDKNKDGQLTKDETRPPRPEGERHGPEGEGKHHGGGDKPTPPPAPPANP